MKYLFNGVEVTQNKLKNYRPIEWQDNYQTVILRELTIEEKIEQLDSWFKTDYAKYEQMFNRRHFLAIEDVIVDEFRSKTYHNLGELYREGEDVAKEIRELKESLKINSIKIL